MSSFYFSMVQLLETLYGEFDALARRRKVFKIETIGDCYCELILAFGGY